MSARRVNVLHVVDSLSFGGTQSILKGYFNSRVGDRSVHLYVMRAAAGPIRIAHANLTMSRSFLRFSMAPLRDLRAIVRERSIDILHCHLFRAQVFGFLLKALFFPRITLVFHEHGRAVGREGESGLEVLLFRWFLRAASRRVDHFACNSDYTRTQLLQVIPAAERKTTVVANPITVSARKEGSPDRAEIRRALQVPDGAFVVGFASRLIERKGWADFLGAMALLAPEIPVHFLLAGDGDDRAKVGARIREVGLQARGRMLGHIDWMARYYAALDCFVMPSRWEPHGLVHLEAQSFGVPVVVSNVPGLASTIQGGVDALLFAAGDVSSLAECIRRLARDGALRESLIAGGIPNSARYTMEAFAASLERIHAVAMADRRASEGGQ